MREIYGKFFYEDVEYPFAYKDYIIYLITGGKVYIDVFKDSDNHKFIEGMDNNGNRLIFLDCEFSKNIFSITNIIKTTGVIVLRGNNKIDCNNIYDRISFRSKALNVFSPPMSILILNLIIIRLYLGITIVKTLINQHYCLVYLFFILNITYHKVLMILKLTI